MKTIAVQILSRDSTYFVDINLCKPVGKDACREIYTLTKGKNCCSDFEQQFPQFMDLNLCTRVQKDICNKKYICGQIQKNRYSHFEQQFPLFCRYKSMKACYCCLDFQQQFPRFMDINSWKRMKKDICNKKYICGQMKKITTHILSSNSSCFVHINL